MNHEKGGFKGGLLTIEATKFMGLASDRIFACDLDSPQGQSVLAWLTRGAEPGSLAATPLGVRRVCQDAGTLAELKTRCAALMSGR